MNHRVSGGIVKWHFKTRTNPFERMVKDCADSNGTQLITNASTEHGLIITKYLLDAAVRDKETVRIVSDDLEDSIPA